MDDKRLDRLFEYTKFRIGIYLTLGAGLMALIAVSSRSGSDLQGIVKHPSWLGLAIISMALAGFSGGVVAGGITRCESFAKFWQQKQGPYGRGWLPGKTWAAIEHTFFWIALVLATASLVG